MQEKIKNELKQAMKDKNMERLNVLRMLSAALTNELVYLQKTPTDTLEDAEVLKVLKRELKKRKDAIEQFTNAGRPELAEEEIKEANIIEEFLPPQMSKEEIAAKVSEKLKAEPVDPSKKGQFVGIMLKELGDSADGALIKEVVDELVK